MEKLDKVRNANASRWITVGDRCSKDFFDFHKDFSRKTMISELVDGARSIRDPKAIEEYVQNFFKELYRNDLEVERNIDGRLQCLGSVPCIVTEEMNIILTGEISELEVEKAVKDLPNDKTPGLDTIPNEILKVLWESIGKDFTEAVQETFDQGQLHPALNEGLMSVIPKNEVLTNIRNFRPISVLYSSYKVMAKTLANRLQPILPSVILPNQTAFVKEHSIFDNIVLATEAVEYARESKQNLVILLLDMEKAYDRVNWTFLEDSMEKLGFLALFIKWTSALYRGASTAILVNGNKCQKFMLERSVRQGCPLAPYLFLFTSEVLSYMINDPKYGIKGLVLPNGEEVRDQRYADDTNLYVEGSPENLERVR